MGFWCNFTGQIECKQVEKSPVGLRVSRTGLNHVRAQQSGIGESMETKHNNWSSHLNLLGEELD